MTNFQPAIRMLPARIKAIDMPMPLSSTPCTRHGPRKADRGHG
jgi:hypothetical protein